MKKISLFLIIILLTFFTASVKVSAAGCDALEKKELQQHASNVKVTFVPTMRETYNNDNQTEGSEQGEITSAQRYMDIKIYNVTSDLLFVMKGSGGTTRMDAVTFDYSKVNGADDAITIRMPSNDQIVNLILEVYASTTSDTCGGEKLKTISLKVPKFNNYSQLQACDGIPEYYLCQEYIDFDIDPDKFYSQVEEYQNKKENPELQDIIVNDNTTAQHNIYIAEKPYMKHIIFCVAVVIVVIIGYFVIKLKKRKKQQDIW